MEIICRTSGECTVCGTSDAVGFFTVDSPRLFARKVTFCTDCAEQIGVLFHKIPSRKVCAYEKCRCDFYIPEGDTLRTESRQRKREAKYCSLACSRAQARLEYKRRV